MSKDDVHREDEIDCDDDTEDEIDTDGEPPELGTTLQAAIAWVLTRDPELTFALAEYELDRMEQLIDRAELTPAMSVEEAWTKLQAAVCTGSVELWGQQFEVPKDFELGHVWPRGSQRRLTAAEVSDLCLIDRRGMADATLGTARVMLPTSSSPSAAITSAAFSAEAPLLPHSGALGFPHQRTA